MTVIEAPQRLKRGRPFGTRGQRVNYALRAFNDGGVQPLEVLVQTMRHHWSEHLRAKQEHEPVIAEIEMHKACEFASRCAPFLHPRLNAVTITEEEMSVGAKEKIDLTTELLEERARHILANI